MNPKKTKSGKYHVTAYIGKVDGKPHYKSFTAATKRECILKATEYINHHKEKDLSGITVKEAVESYIESREGTASPSTIREYDRILRHDLVSLYDIPVNDIDSLTLQRFVSGMQLSPKTIHNRYSFLLSALRMYSDKNYSVTLPPKEEPERTVATDEDIARLLAEASPELRKGILLGACALRRGEICALKYEDVRPGSLYVHADLVQDKYNAWIYKDHAKTPTSTREVLVSPDIIKGLGTGEGYVVKVENPNALTQSFTALRDRLGIDVSLHSLRRYYASICHALGIPDKYIMAQGGWKSASVMRQSYQHVLDDKAREFQDKFDNHLANTIKIQ